MVDCIQFIRKNSRQHKNNTFPIYTYYRNKAKGGETMSQWILIALFVLPHPLIMLFMHKGMHGGSGSMGCCGTQQNSNTDRNSTPLNSSHESISYAVI